MKRIDWGVVLGVFGAFAVLVLLFAFHPFSCVSAKSASRAGGPAPASGSLDLQSEFDSAVASGPVATGAYDSTAASECRYSCAAKIVERRMVVVRSMRLRKPHGRFLPPEVLPEPSLPLPLEACRLEVDPLGFLPSQL